METIQHADAVVRMETKGVYQITVQGKVSPEWCDRLGGMEIVCYRPAPLGAYISVLTGELVDQASLFGILNFLYDTGFPLLAVERVGTDASRVE